MDEKLAPTPTRELKCPLTSPEILASGYMTDNKSSITRTLVLPVRGGQTRDLGIFEKNELVTGTAISHDLNFGAKRSGLYYQER